MSKTPTIAPHPGYVLARPYIENNNTLVSIKDEDGLDQKSEVLSVGDSITDSQGILREAHVKKGDIVLHAFNNSEFTIGSDRFRFIHFTQLHGVLKK